jgi:DNA sulfur modification protein DndC
MNIETQAFIAAQVARGALFVLNHSGGKDSQVQQIVMEGLVPHSQLLVVHADLGEVEWDGCEDHIRATMTGDVELIVCRAGKTFFDMVEHRQMFPSPSNRQCTSDLKRDPISKAIRHYLKAHPEFGGLVINCMGLRAQESAARSSPQSSSTPATAWPGASGTTCFRSTTCQSGRCSPRSRARAKSHTGSTPRA